MHHPAARVRGDARRAVAQDFFDDGEHFGFRTKRGARSLEARDRCGGGVYLVPRVCGLRRRISCHEGGNCCGEVRHLHVWFSRIKVVMN
jgi:hypothetical protein